MGSTPTTTDPSTVNQWGIQVYPTDNGGSVANPCLHNRIDFHSNGLAVTGPLANDPNFFTGYSVEMIFGTPCGDTALLNSTALPDPFPSLSSWMDGGPNGGGTLFFFDFGSGANQTFSGQITSLETATPEPATLVLILTGLVTIVAVRIHRQRARPPHLAD